MPPDGPQSTAPDDSAGAEVARESRLALQPDWQQGVRYRMEARLDEERQVLRGAATLGYRNASPDTLRSLYFHLYLNAFRPGSLWARHEERPDYPFGTLEGPERGFERLRSVRLLQEKRGSGSQLPAAYPHAPDSTVVRVDLPEPLLPGDSLRLALRWDARPATLCRRQCREGRHWDLAQWYPRIAVYDGGGWQAHPLYPQGEFYGEFATYDVTLDLASDQVVGATGVPTEGDPGWAPSAGSPVQGVHLQRDWYGDEGAPVLPDPDLLEEPTQSGRKRVRFRAEDVHHFAWSVDPRYRYEEDVYSRGELPDVRIRVLYRAGDSAWDRGTAARRVIRALSWLESVFRPYPYPQLTVLHRLEDGATEFPMMMMNGSASQGLIVHEAAHQYAHGVLANNEWREAWLDEGMATFLGSWFQSEHGDPEPWTNDLRRVGALDALLARRDRPVALPEAGSQLAVPGTDTLPLPLPVASRSEDFANYFQYQQMSYAKPSVVLYMLGRMLGKETLRRILRSYYDRYEHRHVNEAAFRRTAEDVSGRELDWFFDQWLHTTGTLDYRLGELSLERRPDGSWRTRVEVLREGPIWMPVTLAVGSKQVRLDSREPRQSVTVVTRQRPERVLLDPEYSLLETNRRNNVREIGANPGDGPRDGTSPNEASEAPEDREFFPAGIRGSENIQGSGGGRDP